jgi:hypothetical protein
MRQVINVNVWLCQCSTPQASAISIISPSFSQNSNTVLPDNLNDYLRWGECYDNSIWGTTRGPLAGSGSLA